MCYSDIWTEFSELFHKPEFLSNFYDCYINQIKKLNRNDENSKFCLKENVAEVENEMNTHSDSSYDFFFLEIYGKLSFVFELSLAKIAEFI